MEVILSVAMAGLFWVSCSCCCCDWVVQIEIFLADFRRILIFSHIDYLFALTVAVSTSQGRCCLGVSSFVYFLHVVLF